MKHNQVFWEQRSLKADNFRLSLFNERNACGKVASVLTHEGMAHLACVVVNHKREYNQQGQAIQAPFVTTLNTCSVVLHLPGIQ